MILQRIGGVAWGMSLAACARSYIAPATNGNFDLSGSYDVQAQPTTNKCPEVASEQVRSRLDVQHSPRETQLTVLFEGDAYPGTVRRDGQFASDAIRRNRAGAIETVTMRGRFSGSKISALLEIRRGAVRTVLPTTRAYTAAACSYHVNVSGARIIEESDFMRLGRANEN
jgi:hypothetical protein